MRNEPSRQNAFPPQEIDTWRRRIGPVGVWLGGAARKDMGALPEVAAAIDALGFGALWIGGGTPDQRALDDLTRLLEAGSDLVVASGIANIWAWTPEALHAAASEIDAAHPGRFILGLGVSHPTLVSALGHEYRRPVSTMKEFLDGLDQAAAGSGRRRPFTVLAALRSRMLHLARERSGGAHPYFVPVAHTAVARKVLGPTALLATEQAVVVDADPDRARTVARQHVSRYLQLPNYVHNLAEYGFGDEDFTNGGSDRLVDSIVAWGSVDRIAARIREHLTLGADHVAIQPLDAQGGLGLEQLRDLAPVLVAAP
ncbi:MAG: TIGR03620 family F420-dependent LLM class oxidoreductase [Candidatus Dormibacteraceae bacterium]